MSGTLPPLSSRVPACRRVRDLRGPRGAPTRSRDNAAHCAGEPIIIYGSGGTSPSRTSRISYSGTFFSIDESLSPKGWDAFEAYYDHSMCLELARSLIYPQDTVGTRLLGWGMDFPDRDAAAQGPGPASGCDPRSRVAFACDSLAAVCDSTRKYSEGVGNLRRELKISAMFLGPQLASQALISVQQATPAFRKGSCSARFAQTFSFPSSAISDFERALGRPLPPSQHLADPNLQTFRPAFLHTIFASRSAAQSDAPQPAGFSSPASLFWYLPEKHQSMKFVIDVEKGDG